MYFTTDMRDHNRKAVSEAQARAWAARWGHGLPPGGQSYVDRYFPPAAPSAAGASGHVDPARLARAIKAGQAARSAGFGPPVRADGRVPCFHCGKCDAGGYSRCQKSLSPAEVRLHDAQAVDTDRVKAEVVAAELAWLHVELSAHL